MMILVALIALAGCDLTEALQLDDGLDSYRLNTTSDSSGLAALEVEVRDGDAAFLVTAESDAILALEAIYDEQGDRVLYWDDWYDGDLNLTGSIYPQAEDTVINWPVREGDDKLSAGTWTVYIGTLEPSGSSYAYAGDHDVTATVQRKVDSSLREGTVSARIIFAEGVGDDGDIVAATEQAVDRWREVWEAYGLGLEVAYTDGSIDPDLAWPTEGDADLEDASAAGSDSEITVIIGETIDGGADYYGVAGSIPGALVSTPRSVVVLSWLANSGADGVFGTEDVRLFGETLAHEVGHYTGLFHPVESDLGMFDALDDTDECSTISECEDVLGDNLMFPYPICGYTSCEPQDVLTAGQMGVAQRYTGTL